MKDLKTRAEVAAKKREEMKKDHQNIIKSVEKIEKGITDLAENYCQILKNQGKVNKTLAIVMNGLPIINEKIADNYFNLAEMFNSEVSK